jgi:hypothetical protein
MVQECCERTVVSAFTICIVSNSKKFVPAKSCHSNLFTMRVKESNQFCYVSLDYYAKLVSTIPQISIKGKILPFTTYNGYVFSFLDKDGVLALRLPSKARKTFIRKYRATCCEANGTVLKEYVVIPEKLITEIEELKQYFELSFQYVSKLRSKPKR